MAAAWITEGAALAQALKAPTYDEAVRLAQKFLEIRDARRGAVRLSPELADYERELEWLEGLAKYAEVHFYELAASRADQTASIKFNPGLPIFLQWDFVRLEKQLGTQEGDLRFYLSGMAQARLLDRLSPDWKSKVGAGTSVQWPAGLGGKGNEGVAGIVQQQPGGLVGGAQATAGWPAGSLVWPAAAGVD